MNIHEGVKDCQGKALGTSHTISFSEVSLKPQVEMSTTAAILPDSKSLIIPFRAVNLYAVDSVSYTHLDVYKRQAVCYHLIGGNVYN